MVRVEDHAIHLLENLNRQRQSEQFCDVVLKVEDQHFSAHRNVLSACSEYFRTMFQSKMREQYAKDVSLEGVTAAAVEQVLEYIYTEKINLSEDNISDVMQAASLMLLTELLEVISDYLLESVSPSTCLYLRDVSKLFNLESLKKKSEECIFENFEEVASQEKFCDLNEADVSQFLSSDDLKEITCCLLRIVPHLPKLAVHSENVVFEALILWVNKDQTQRRSLFPSMFKHIRLQHVSQGFLITNLRKQPLVKQFHECRDIVDDALHYHIQPQSFEAQKRRRGSGFFLLNQQGGVEHFDFTPGGLDVTQMKHGNGVYSRGYLGDEALRPGYYETLDVAADWSCLIGKAYALALGKIDKPKFQVYFTYAIAKSNQTVYLCGSHANNSSSVISFNGQNFKLEGNMKKIDLAEATAFCIGDHLYVAGGSNQQGMDVYQLRPSFKFTETIQTNQLHCASSVVIGGDAYVIGGKAQNGYEQSTVNSFNAATKEWTNKQNLNEARQWCGAAVLGSKIFACGGFKNWGGEYLNSMEYMDIAQNVWTKIGSNCRENLGHTSIYVAGKELYVVGMNCKVLWKYDTESEKWNQDQRYGNRPGCFRILSLN